MIAVSSLRPLSKCTPEVVRNQTVAKRSWDSVFERIIYLNQTEPELDSPKTEWKGSDGCPMIRDLMQHCQGHEGWSCIVNADILIRPTVFKRILATLREREAVAAISRRWQFEPEATVRTLTLADLGLDIFCATREVWKEAFRVVPDQFRIGHCLWDTWMLGFLNLTSNGNWYDFTPSKCVLHPAHGSRKTDYIIDTSYRDQYLLNVNFPTQKLT